MAQMEKTWIDERSFEQITLETVPTGKYNDTYKMILENPKLFSTDISIYDWDIAKLAQKIQDTKLEVEILNRRIEKIKNPPKKKKAKKTDSEEEDEEYDDSVNVALQLDKLHSVIAEKQGVLKTIQEYELELEILKYTREMNIKKTRSLNRLIKEYNVTKDTTYLEKGVHWISEYADSMIEREKRHMTTRMIQ